MALDIIGIACIAFGLMDVAAAWVLFKLPRNPGAGKEALLNRLKLPGRVLWFTGLGFVGMGVVLLGLTLQA